MRLNLNQILFQPGQTLLLKDIDWSTFETLLEELGDKRAARISYSGELLEIMTPLAIHESDKELIGDLVKIILEEMDLEFWALGSTTFKNAHMAQAVEPDQCFYITHEAAVRNKEQIELTVDPPPDLAIEIDITARSRFDNYQKLGVPEVWRYDGKKLEMNVLQDERYSVVERSRLFPDLPLNQAIPTAVARSHEKGRNATMRQFRVWVRTQIHQ